MYSTSKDKGRPTQCNTNLAKCHDLRQVNRIKVSISANHWSFQTRHMVDLCMALKCVSVVMTLLSLTYLSLLSMLSIVIVPIIVSIFIHIRCHSHLVILLVLLLVLLSLSFLVGLIILILAGVPVGGKSSVCLICMKYRIIILIIIIKRPGEILLSYIANTSRTRTHALTQC